MTGHIKGNLEGNSRLRRDQVITERCRRGPPATQPAVKSPESPPPRSDLHRS